MEISTFRPVLQYARFKKAVSLPGRTKTFPLDKNVEQPNGLPEGSEPGRVHRQVDQICQHGADDE